MYTSGSSEELLGKIDYKARGLLLETKLYPTAVGPPPVLFANLLLIRDAGSLEGPELDEREDRCDLSFAGGT